MAVIVLTICAGGGLTRAIKNVLNPYGAIDLHLFWYNGHYFRQGLDPYAGYLDNQPPPPPVHYLDGANIVAVAAGWGTYLLVCAAGLWSLLFFYHRAYDFVLAYSALVLLVYALTNPAEWGVADGARAGLAAFTTLCIILLSLPGNLVGENIPGWNNAIEATNVLGVFALLGGALWLWKKRTVYANAVVDSAVPA